MRSAPDSLDMRDGADISSLKRIDSPNR